MPPSGQRKIAVFLMTLLMSVLSTFLKISESGVMHGNPINWNTTLFFDQIWEQIIVLYGIIIMSKFGGVLA